MIDNSDLSNNILTDRIKQYKELIEKLDEGIVIVDEYENFIFANPAAYKLLSIPVDKDISDIHLKDFLNESSFEKVKQQTANRKKGISSTYELELIREDGETRTVLVSASPREDLGEYKGSFVVFQDITEKKEAEQERLNENIKRMEAITRTAQDAIILMDHNGNISYWNPAAEKIFGYSKDEVLGENLHKLLAPEKYYNEHIQNFHRFQKSGEGFAIGKTLELEAIKKDGSLIDIELSLSALEIQGEWHSAGIIRDITERKKNELRLSEYNKKLKSKNKELDSLYMKLDEEINKALKLHERTLPKNLPNFNGFKIFNYYQPAARLGGDFYDLKKHNDQVVFYVSDVTGHGLDAAMLSHFIKTTINNYLTFNSHEKLNSSDIVKFLAAQFFQENYPEDYFICIFLFVLDLDEGLLNYTGMGFQDKPILIDSNKSIELISRNLPITNTVSFDYFDFTSNEMQFSPGDKLLVNTDGITEVYNGKKYYQKRFINLVNNNADLPAEKLGQRLIDDLYEFNNNSFEVKDDITLLIIEQTI